MMIKAGIIGATGYAGGEIVRILANHPDVEVVWYGSRSYIDKKYADVFSNMFQIVEGKCLDDNMEELAEQADVIFTATPQGPVSYTHLDVYKRQGQRHLRKQIPAGHFHGTSADRQEAGGDRPQGRRCCHLPRRYR